MMKNFQQYLFNYIAPFLAAFAPISSIIYTLTFIIILDFIFGIWKSIKFKDKITSRKMSQSISKIFLYNLLIIGLFAVDKYVFKTGLDLENLGASLILIVEMKSIDEHFTNIFGYSIWDRVSEQFKRGKSLTK